MSDDEILKVLSSILNDCPFTTTRQRKARSCILKAIKTKDEKLPDKVVKIVELLSGWQGPEANKAKFTLRTLIGKLNYGFREQQIAKPQLPGKVDWTRFNQLLDIVIDEIKNQSTGGSQYALEKAQQAKQVQVKNLIELKIIIGEMLNSLRGWQGEKARRTKDEIRKIIKMKRYKKYID